MTEPDAPAKLNELSDGPEAALVRSEAWAGEVRINLIRLAALVFFYARHLSSVYLFKDDPDMTAARHAAVTAIVLLWPWQPSDCTLCCPGAGCLRDFPT